MTPVFEKGSIRHEYAPHLHCDYEPESALPPQPRLVYDAATDGILPNDYYDPVTNPTHRHHDWDGAARGGPGIKTLGDWDCVDSKTGSLYKSLHYLARLQAENRQTLCARTGSFDFGVDPRDQEISTRAYECTGLRANSDARFAAGDPMPGGHLYWCRRDDRFQPITRLEDACLVQMAVTRDVSFDLLEDINGWFEKHRPTCGGPGIHALVIMTHAMFMRGARDAFRSLEGGSFEILDQHLAWVRENYPEVEFATASEVITEYLDYYSPTLVGIVDSRLIGGDPDSGRFVFSVRLLGRGIFVSADKPATVRLHCPAWFQPSEIAEVVVRRGAEVVCSSDRHQIEIHLMDRSTPLTLEVVVREDQAARVAAAFRRSGGPVFHEVPERREPDLFRIRTGEASEYAADLQRLCAPERSMIETETAWAAETIARLLTTASGEPERQPISAEVRIEWPQDPWEEFTIALGESTEPVESKAVDRHGRVVATALVRFQPGEQDSKPLGWVRRMKQLMGIGSR